MKRARADARKLGAACQFSARRFRAWFLPVIGTSALLTAAVAVTVPSGSASAAPSTISAVGGLASTAGSGVTTLSVDPQNAGDAFVVVVKVSSSSITVSSVSGGKAGTWTKLEAHADGSHDNELWLGTIASSGASTLTVTFSGSVSGDDVDLAAQEFTAGLGSGTSWTAGPAGGQSNPAANTFSFPSLTPSGSVSLYFGYARGGGTLSAGTTAGFTYDTTADGNLVAFDPDISATVAPNGDVTPSVTTSAVGALLSASSSGTSTTTTTSASSTTTTAPTGTTTTTASTTTTTTPTSTISAVGGLASTAGSGVTTLSVDPQNAGDAFVVVVKVSSSSITVSSVSGGKAGTWTKLEAHADGSHDNELWLGTIASSGASTLTVTFSGSVSGDDVDLAAQEFTAGLGSGTSWTAGPAGGQSNPAANTFSFPSLTPSGSVSLYFGYARGGGTLSAGTTAGFTYDTTADGNLVAFDPDISATVAPNGDVTPSVTTSAVGALLSASSSGTSTTTTTSASSTTTTAPTGTTTTTASTTTTTTPTSTISAVGGLASTTGSGVTRLSVDPRNVGDALVVLVHIVASNATVSSISGGGSSGWARYQQYLDTPSWSGQPHDTEIWVGKVGSTGSSTITVTYSQSVTFVNIDLDAQEFDAGFGRATLWTLDTGSGEDNDASSTNVQYPALTPSASAELYFGYAWVPGTSAPGSTPGVTYDVTADTNLICFDPDVSTELAPVGSQTVWAPSASIAVLIRAT